jgi:hypothetical protein
MVQHWFGFRGPRAVANKSVEAFRRLTVEMQRTIYSDAVNRKPASAARTGPPSLPQNCNRVPRPSAPEDILRVEMPRLRIVDQDLWDAAQKVRQDRAHIYGGKRGTDRGTTARRLHPFAVGNVP